MCIHLNMHACHEEGSKPRSATLFAAIDFHRFRLPLDTDYCDEGAAMKALRSRICCDRTCSRHMQESEDDMTQRTQTVPTTCARRVMPRNECWISSLRAESQVWTLNLKSEHCTSSLNTGYPVLTWAVQSAGRGPPPGAGSIHRCIYIYEIKWVYMCSHRFAQTTPRDSHTFHRLRP